MILVQGLNHFGSFVKCVCFSGGYVRRLPLERQLTSALCGAAALVPAYILIAIARQQWLFYCGMALYAFGKLIASSRTNSYCFVF